MIEVAQKREFELELQKKRKQIHIHNTIFFSQDEAVDLCSRRQKGPRYNKWGKSHEGAYSASGCYKYGKKGHFGHYCKQGMRVCFNCSQVGHFKAKCPLLATIGAV